MERTVNQRQPIIVVVDPDADRATALSSRLDRKGYHVVRRSSGIDTLQCVAECRPDLVLSEAALPDVESPELLHSIHEISPSTQVLFITRREGSSPLPEDPADGVPGQPAGAEGTDEVVQEVDRLLDMATFQE